MNNYCLRFEAKENTKNVCKTKSKIYCFLQVVGITLKYREITVTIYDIEKTSENT